MVDREDITAKLSTKISASIHEDDANKDHNGCNSPLAVQSSTSLLYGVVLTGNLQKSKLNAETQKYEQFESNQA